MASRLWTQSLAGVRKERGERGEIRAAPYTKQRPRRHDDASMQGAWKHDKLDTTRGHRPSETIATKVTVQGLHYEVTEAELEDLFAPIGHIAKGPSIKFDASGRSTGNAVVWYESAQDAEAAVKEFDGAKAKGETICVQVAGPSRVGTTHSRSDAPTWQARSSSLLDRLQGTSTDTKMVVAMRNARGESGVALRPLLRRWTQS
ncbi:hypothetical protein MVES_001656 [Malassezia vespertilionis]|uniref:RRM domain-containing protein n=1 Tax=Malassezia vespertilionis TaxID=2020962 RepID=A0A2N1JD86_9BASI|nr:hypothetical protein MVES_001656 [Malassezia vespertilionis]